ncbi:MAG: calcium-binding protein [Amaricoccus sp.]
MAIDYSQNNLIYGTAGDDVINAGAGDDTVYGQAGNDRLLGGPGNDWLFGGPGNDTLDGGPGEDRLEGGAGNDRYYVDTLPFTVWDGSKYVAHPGDTIVEAPGAAGGIDTVYASVNWTLGDNLENLVLTGLARIGTGNALANTITGTIGADLLDGGAGNDTLIGGDGNDWMIDSTGTDRYDGGAGRDLVDYSANKAMISANLAAGTVSFPGHTWPTETLISIEHLRTGSANDSVLGSAVGNRIETNAGDDFANGAAGNDTLIGGFGNDSLHGGDGNDVLAGGLYGDQAVQDPADGPALFKDGQDLLDGGAGTDTVSYARAYFDDEPLARDEVDAALQVDLRAGTAQVIGVAGTLDRLVSIENVETANGDDIVYGNGLANAISVHDGSNRVDGGGGNDTITGGAGLQFPNENDTGKVWTHTTIETLSGGDGNDTILSNGSIADYATWHADGREWARDLLSGGNGDDRLVAGVGGYMDMVGGAGADRFEFSTELYKSWDYFYGTDGIRGEEGTVADFSRAAGDKIVVKAVHDDLYTPAGHETDQLSFAGTAADPGYFKLHYHHATGDDGQTDTVVQVTVGTFDQPDLNVPDAVLTITLNDFAGSLQASDFVFV